ncbi:MAG: hypothetical protein JKY25_10570 [Robiginitomaculum sp.]|nr:hypothetical protein [Robiginitomaculum sp.]
MNAVAILAVAEAGLRLLESYNISATRFAQEREHGPITPERLFELRDEAQKSIDEIGED